MKYQKVQFTHKKNKTLVKIFYNETEVSLEGNQHAVEVTKKTDQYMSKSLQHCVDVFKPHLLFASELAGDKINLNKELDYVKWFKDSNWEQDERFVGVEITEIQFIGNDALDSVKIKGYRTTQKTDKPFKVKIETPVVNLAREVDNAYAMVVILDDQSNSLLIELDEFVKGKTLSRDEQLSLIDQLERQEAE